MYTGSIPSNLFEWKVALCGVIFLIWIVIFFQRLPKKAVRKLVGHVSTIYTYPLKSGKYISSPSVTVTNLGLKHDRQFVLLNKYGTFMTLRKYPKFVHINQEITEENIILRAEGMPDLKLPLRMTENEGDHTRDVTVWRKKTAGVHVSDEVDEWFAKYFNEGGCKLYCFPTGGKPRFSEDKGVLEDPNYNNKLDTLMFADGCPLMILSESSIENLNENLEEKVKAERFRPNIVISGCEPYEEDEWINIEVGTARFRGLYPCSRCVAVNVDPYTAEKDDIVLSTLQRVRLAPPAKYPKLKGDALFGCNYGVRREGEIKVGDPVYLVS